MWPFTQGDLSEVLLFVVGTIIFIFFIKIGFLRTEKSRGKAFMYLTPILSSLLGFFFAIDQNMEMNISGIIGYVFASIFFMIPVGFVVIVCLEIVGGFFEDK